MQEIDIYRAANLFIDRYGTDATIHAAMKSDAMLAKGDLNGAAVWRRVIKAIAALQELKGQTVH